MQLLAYEQKSPSNRVASKGWYKEGFTKRMTDFKTKTGGKVLLVLKNKDKKGKLTIYTKSSQELSYSNMQGEGVEAYALNNSVLNSTSIPSFTEYARFSPSIGETNESTNVGW